MVISHVHLDAEARQARKAAISLGRVCPQSPTRPVMDDESAQRLGTHGVGEMPRNGVGSLDPLRADLLFCHECQRYEFRTGSDTEEGPRYRQARMTQTPAAAMNWDSSPGSGLLREPLIPPRRPSPFGCGHISIETEVRRRSATGRTTDVLAHSTGEVLGSTGVEAQNGLKSAKARQPHKRR